MLCITRRDKEAIWIGDVRLVIREIGKSHVKLGFEGPQEVKILREELKHTGKTPQRGAGTGTGPTKDGGG